MQITFTIADKLIKSAITNALENEVYQNWDTATIKAAKIPKITAMTTAIFNDPKFQAVLIDHLTDTAECVIEDQIFDMMDEINIPQIQQLCETVDRVAFNLDILEQEKKEAAEVQRMIMILSKAGFKIEKSK